jgi:hypothetical protein
LVAIASVLLLIAALHNKRRAEKFQGIFVQCNISVTLTGKSLI